MFFAKLTLLSASAKESLESFSINSSCNFLWVAIKSCSVMLWFPSEENTSHSLYNNSQRYGRYCGMAYMIYRESELIQIPAFFCRISIILLVFIRDCNPYIIITSIDIIGGASLIWPIITLRFALVPRRGGFWSAILQYVTA